MLIRLDRRRIPLFLLIVGVFLPFMQPGFVVASETADARIWPVPIKINLTSSFGEFRSGHLHAGIDIKTGGREGVECLAVGDGFVSRLRASPYGYGKAVYVELYSGETVVYAHMAEFSPDLEEVLYREQVAAGGYRVDVYYERDELPVRQGDSVGFTGRTGTRGPHLHFEVRDAQQNPINPLSVGWLLTDRRRPEFRRALWLPLSSESTVDGLPVGSEVTLRKIDKGRYVAADTVMLSGRFGLGAYIIDRINDASGRLAPYHVDVSVDGTPLASITMESFTYTHTGEVELAYEMGRARSRGEYFLLLFERDGESLWNREFQRGGVIDTGELAEIVGPRDVYTAEVRAIDRAGNESVATVPFRVGTARAPGAVGAAQSGLPGAYFFGDLMAVEPGALTLASVETPQRSPGDWLVFDATGPRPPATLDFVQGEREFGVHAFTVPGSGGVSRSFPALGINLLTTEKSLFSDAFMYVAPWGGPASAKAETGLTPASRPVQLGPLSLALNKTVEMKFAIDGAPDGREAVYRLNVARGEWGFAGVETAEDSVSVRIGAPGIYRVFVDKTPPQIGKAQLKSRLSYATNEQVPEIVIPIDDRGSGIDAGATHVMIDGHKQIARWDGFTKLLHVTLRDKTVRNSHDVAIVAVDRVGNSSRVESTVELSRNDQPNDLKTEYAE